MSSVEERLRDAFRADAQTVTAIRELGDQATARASTAGRSGTAQRAWRETRRPGRRLFIPLAAAAAVIAIVVTSALIVPRLLTGSIATGPMPQRVRLALFGSAAIRQPPFMVGVFNGNGSVGDIGVYNPRTGRMIAQLSPPKGLTFQATAPTGDDLTFVVAAQPRSRSCSTSFYRLRLTPQGRVASLTPLAVPKVRGEIMPPSGLSASASGDVIAYTANACGSGKGWVGVIRLASGTVSTWRADAEDLWSLSLSASGSALLYVDSTVYGGDGTVRLLRTDAPAGPLATRARIVLPASLGIGGTGSVALSSNGKTLLACVESQPEAHTATMSAYDVTTGSALGEVYQWRNVYVSPCMISAVPAGRYVLVSDIMSRGIGSRVDLSAGKAWPVPGGGQSPPAGISW